MRSDHTTGRCPSARSRHPTSSAVKSRRAAPKASRHRKTTGPVGLFNAGLLADPPAWLHVCEAPLDALTLAIYGVSAVALVGTALGEQVRAFRRCRGVLLALDGDPAGEKATIAAAGALRGLGIVVQRLPVVALGGADDLNAAHMADVLRLPPLPTACGVPYVGGTVPLTNSKGVARVRCSGVVSAQSFAPSLLSVAISS